MNQPSPVLYLVIPLILWRIYARVRRNIGRQKSRAWRHWFSVAFFPLLVVLIAATSAANALAEGALLGGAAGGVALAFYGVKLTRFEVNPNGYYYTPNAYLGVGLSLLLVARVLWRMSALYAAQGALVDHGATAQNLARSPATLVLFGLVAGYYATYSAALLLWRKRTPVPPLV
jgi:hypothetical protein